MKKIHIFIIIIVESMIITSCGGDFLDLSSETSITSSSFYKTADHFDQALVASYQGLRTIAESGIIMDELRCDNTFYNYYSIDRGAYTSTESIALFLDEASGAANNGVIYNRYQSDYTNIARLNTILDRMDAADLTDSEKISIKSEALFLRAYYYFDLVQHWGGVPLMIHEVTNASNAYVAKSTKEEVYKQILSDVTESINDGLPIATSFPQNGRATLGAAKMLRAYVNMTSPTKDYPTAQQDLIDITNMDYGLEENYADVFSPTNKNQKESIFEVQYTEDGSSDQYNIIPWRIIPKCGNTVELMGIYGNNLQSGNGGGWCVPTQEMINAYENGDKRLSASIAVGEGRFESEIFYCDEVKTLTDGYIPTAGKDICYWVRKYFHPSYKYSMRAGENFPIYRYAGALLLLAECLVDQGKNDEALPYVNQVRNRAGLKNLTSVTAENVEKEMRIELAFENHRWTDLIRRENAVEVMNAFGVTEKAVHGWLSAYSKSFNVTDNRLIYAFPQREIDVNNLLEQNPGY